MKPWIFCTLFGTALLLAALYVYVGTTLEPDPAAVMSGSQQQDDAQLGHVLRQLAEAGEAPMLVHTELGWRCHLKCGRSPFPWCPTALDAAKDADER